MSSTGRTTMTAVPAETALGFVLVGLLTGVLAGDAVVGLLFLALAISIYLLYRILRTLELIAAKL